MNLESNGATNGAPQENEEISCVIVAGDFLKLLLEQQVKEESIEKRAINSGIINALRESDIPITIKLESNNERDLAFFRMCEENPLIAKMKLTPEEWQKRLDEYIQRTENGDKEV